MDISVEKPIRETPEASRCVLVVDDEESILGICRAHLEKACMTVLTAPSAEEALALLDSHAVDVLLSDFSMPGMTGADLLAAASERSPETMRVLFTGLGDTHIAEEAMVRGKVFRFLVKPFAAEGLVSCVKDALQARRAAKEARQRQAEIEGLARDQATDLAAAHAFLESLLFAFPAGVLVAEADGVIS